MMCLSFEKFINKHLKMQTNSFDLKRILALEKEDRNATFRNSCTRQPFFRHWSGHTVIVEVLEPNIVSL